MVLVWRWATDTYLYRRRRALQTEIEIEGSSLFYDEVSGQSDGVFLYADA